MKNINQETYDKIKAECYLSGWLIFIGAIIGGTLELTSIIIGKYNITGFTFVVAVYFFIAVFVFLLYGEKIKWVRK